MPDMPPLHRPRGQRSRAEANREADRRRGNERERGYDGRWRKASAEFRRANPFCAYCQVGAFGPPTVSAAELTDHLYPHRGDEALFWRREWWVACCTACHSGAKQTAERAGAHQLHRLADLLSRPRCETFTDDGSARAHRPGSSSTGAMAHPSWFRRAFVPLTIVCGPPGAGKSTYVRGHARPTDRIICFDALATSRFGRAGIERSAGRLRPDQVADVLRERNEALGDLMRPRACERWSAAWLIVTEPQAEHRAWWAEVVGARVVVLPTPAEECLLRIESDARAGDVRPQSAGKSSGLGGKPTVQRPATRPSNGCRCKHRAADHRAATALKAAPNERIVGMGVETRTEDRSRARWRGRLGRMRELGSSARVSDAWRRRPNPT